MPFFHLFYFSNVGSIEPIMETVLENIWPTLHYSTESYISIYRNAIRINHQGLCLHGTFHS